MLSCLRLLCERVHGLSSYIRRCVSVLGKRSAHLSCREQRQHRHSPDRRFGGSTQEVQQLPALLATGGYHIQHPLHKPSAGFAVRAKTPVPATCAVVLMLLANSLWQVGCP